MRFIFIIIISVFCWQFTLAQTPYNGGEGEGYASERIDFEVVNSIQDNNLKIDIYPTIVKPNQFVNVEIENQVNSAVLVNATGKMYSLNPQNGFYIPSTISAGVYAVIIKSNEKVYYSKLVVMHE